MLAVCGALSTAFRPFTAVAPPVDVLMRSQPGASGWQLTEGTGKEEPAVRLPIWVAERWVGPRSEGGMAKARSSDPDARPVPSWWPDAAAAVDGVLSGPLSRWQSMRHPVAAGPAKVGLKVPRLDVVTASVGALAALLCQAAAADPTEALSIIAGTDSSDTSAILRR